MSGVWRRSRWLAGRIDAAAARAVRGRPRLDSHTLLLQARRRAQLEDFGRSRFRASLDRVVDGLDADAELTMRGRRAAQQVVVEALVNRLEVVDRAKKHPHDLAVELPAPIVITGAPGAAIAEATAALRHVSSSEVPGDPMGGAELLRSTFCSLGYEIAFGPGVPSACEAEWDEAYEFHQLQLKVLSGGDPVQWVLAGPEHLAQLPALAQVYPCARVMWVRGDPATEVDRMARHSARRLSTWARDVDLSRLRDHWSTRHSEWPVRAPTVAAVDVVELDESRLRADASMFRALLA